MPTIDLMTGLRIEFTDTDVFLRFEAEQRPSCSINIASEWREHRIVGPLVNAWITERRAELAQKEKHMSDMGCDSFERSERMQAKAQKEAPMNETAQWVCHVSGQGEKYKVEVEHKPTYQVRDPEPGGVCLYLPKRDYKPCPPPRRWEDCTSLVSISQDGRALVSSEHTIGTLPKGQRWAWVVSPAVESFNLPQRNYLTIEREVSE